MIPALLIGLFLLRADSPAFKTTTLRLEDRTRVTIRHAVDASDAPKPPRVHVTVFVGDKSVRQFDVAGADAKIAGTDWTPWGLENAVARDVDGDGTKETLLTTFCTFGGFGTARYLTIMRRVGSAFAVVDVPRTSAENIHTGNFFLARSNKGAAGVVVTRPLMDGESHADPTRWEVAVYRLVGAKAVFVSSKKTAKGYSETLPRAAIAGLLPSGWTITSPAL